MQLKIDMCYYLGDDVLLGHVLHNPKWNTTSTNVLDGIRAYITDLTEAANRIMSK